MALPMVLRVEVDRHFRGCVETVGWCYFPSVRTEICS